MPLRRYTCSNLIALLCLCVTLSACHEESAIPDEGTPISPTAIVPDPEGTVSISMRTSNSGKTQLDDIYIHNENFAGAHFVSVGYVNGLGNISKIPSKGWASEVSVIERHGYVAYCNDVFYRIFVENNYTNKDNEIIGYDVKYQKPFKGIDEAITLPMDSIMFQSNVSSERIFFKNENIIPFYVESDQSWCHVQKCSSFNEYFLSNGIEIYCYENLNEGTRIANISITTLYGRVTTFKVIQQAKYLFYHSFLDGFGSFTTHSEQGNISWTTNSRYGAVITGYNNWENKAGVTYLISSEISLTDIDSAYLQIEQAINYAKLTPVADHKLLIRGGNENWYELPMRLNGLGTSFEYIPQNIQIPQHFIGKRVQIALKHTAHESYSSTWEVKNIFISKGTAPKNSFDDEELITDGIGSGTKDDPYDVPTTIKLIVANPPSTPIYTKGIVSQIDEVSEQYGNATYYISNDGTTTDQLLVYRGLGIGGRRFGAGDLRVGDQVIVYGVVVNYAGSKPEFTQGNQLYSLNGRTEEDNPTPDPQPSGDATGSGTLEDPFNAAKANEVASALASGAESSQAYYIKGKVASIATDKDGNVQNFDYSTFGNATFYISDDGTTNEFYVYRSLYLGNQKWTSGAGPVLQVGDEVIVYAKLTNYRGNTPETVQGATYLYSLNGQTEAGETPDTPDTQPSDEAKTLADFTNGNFETWTDDSQPTGWKSASAASSATLAKSTDAHGGSFAVCVKGASQNKRLAYEEMELEAGTYNCSFWTKAATSAAASLCPGYAVPGSSIFYNYDKADDGKNKYVNDIGATWQKVTYSFTLTEKTTVCLVIMNSKTTGTDLLIDDFTITKN